MLDKLELPGRPNRVNCESRVAVVSALETVSVSFMALSLKGSVSSSLDESQAQICLEVRGSHSVGTR